jgi:hypothetical protein
LTTSSSSHSNRFAAISVRESIPQPFCCEKKLTDSLILNGKATDPSDLYRLVVMEQYHKSPEELIYNRAENPFYDAEVEEDLKMIQRRYEEKEEMKKRKLRKKMLKSSLESIPHIEYHPDDVVIQMAKEQEGDGDLLNNETDVRRFSISQLLPLFLSATRR